MTNANTLTFRLALVALLATPAAHASESAASPHGKIAATPPVGFGNTDVNRDGWVSQDEFVAQGGLVQAFKEGDVNADGKLSEDEFIKASANEDRIKVGKYLSDTAITAKIKATLLKDELVKGLDVSVETREGEVQLSGWVDSAEQIARAGKLAAGISGVKTVHNDLQIKKG